MTEPRYKYLTKSYVEWLGLEPVTILSGSATSIYIRENDTKPVTPSPFKQSVTFEGEHYIQSEDGHSFDWAGSRPYIQ